jgi:hypothetical protein
VNFDETLSRDMISAGIELFHSANELNDLFTLTCMIMAGKDHNLRLPVAFGYGTLLGTKTMSAEELKKELYRYGLSLSMSSGDRYSTVTLSGLNENLAKGIDIMYDLITGIKPDEEVLSAYVDKILKERG